MTMSECQILCAYFRLIQYLKVADAVDPAVAVDVDVNTAGIAIVRTTIPETGSGLRWSESGSDPRKKPDPDPIIKKDLLRIRT